MPPELWMIVGGNGSGKSTFYQRYLYPRGMPFVNADRIAREIWPENPERWSYAASQKAAELRERLLQNRQTFAFETVFSHPSKIDFMGKAKAHGYVIKMIVLHLASPELNQARVYQRVSQGGHHVPEEKVRTRLERVPKFVSSAIALCNEVDFLDNSRIGNEAFRRVASMREGTLYLLQTPPPGWLPLYVDIQ